MKFTNAARNPLGMWLTDSQSGKFSGKRPTLSASISGELFAERLGSVQAPNQNHNGHEFADDRRLEALMTR
jgi:hypothetical protein